VYKLEWVDGVDADADDFMFTTATGLTSITVTDHTSITATALISMPQRL